MLRAAPAMRPIVPVVPRAQPPERVDPLPRVAPTTPRSVRPVSVPPPATAPLPIRVAEPSLPLLRVPTAPLHGASPSPPAALLPTPARLRGK